MMGGPGAQGASKWGAGSLRSRLAPVLCHAWSLAGSSLLGAWPGLEHGGGPAGR